MLETCYQHMVGLGSSLSSKVYNGLRVRKYLSWFLNTTKLDGQTQWGIPCTNHGTCRQTDSVPAGKRWDMKTGARDSLWLRQHTKEFKFDPESKGQLQNNVKLSKDLHCVQNYISDSSQKDGLEVITVNDWGFC